MLRKLADPVLAAVVEGSEEVAEDSEAASEVATEEAVAASVEAVEIVKTVETVETDTSQAVAPSAVPLAEVAAEDEVDSKVKS